jgi:hypothetical protein
MNGLDAHYSALWVEAERRLNKPTAKYTVSIAVEGYVDVVIEATSQAEAEASAIDKIEVQGMTITDVSITDVEKWT